MKSLVSHKFLAVLVVALVVAADVTFAEQKVPQQGQPDQRGSSSNSNADNRPLYGGTAMLSFGEWPSNSSEATDPQPMNNNAGAAGFF